MLYTIQYQSVFGKNDGKSISIFIFYKEFDTKRNKCIFKSNADEWGALHDECARSGPDTSAM